MKFLYPHIRYFITVIIIGLSAGTDTIIAQVYTQKVSYVSIYVDGLSCPFCAYGIEKKLKKIKDVKEFDILMKEGIVRFNVPIESKPSEEELIKIIEDAGFTSRKIMFSKHPFKEDHDEDLE